MNIKRKIIIHPFLFAIFPVLFLFSHNIDQASFFDTLLPSAISFGFTIMLVSFLSFILRDVNKAGIISTLFLILFFSYGHIYNLKLTWHIGQFFIGRHRYLMIVWGLIFITCTFVVIKIRINWYEVTKVLNSMVFILVITSIINVGIYKFKIKPGGKTNFNDRQDNVTEIRIDPEISRLSDITQLRDIYYIILDGYARSDTLKEIYNYDNREFIDYLSDRGFYIAMESLSNYAMTHLSLASSLNMKYINYLSEEIGEDSRDQRILNRMIKNSLVMKYLKSMGYKFIHFSSGLGATNFNQYADRDPQGAGINEFQIILIQSTMLAPFENFFVANSLRHKILSTFSELGQIPKITDSKFIFAHIIAPHPPFIFDANGKPAQTDILKMGGMVWTQKEKYLDQLIFVNTKVKMFIDEILLHSEHPPIIILQADHGPSSALSDGILDGWNKPTDRMIQERMRIFNAYHMPSGGSKFIYNEITPVNTFRIIFNFYFGADNEVLKDKSFFSNYDQPYKFNDVTDIVNYD